MTLTSHMVWRDTFLSLLSASCPRMNLNWCFQLGNVGWNLTIGVASCTYISAYSAGGYKKRWVKSEEKQPLFKVNDYSFCLTVAFDRSRNGWNPPPVVFECSEAGENHTQKIIFIYHFCVKGRDQWESRWVWKVANYKCIGFGPWRPFVFQFRR